MCTGDTAVLHHHCLRRPRVAARPHRHHQAAGRHRREQVCRVRRRHAYQAVCGTGRSQRVPRGRLVGALLVHTPEPAALRELRCAGRGGMLLSRPTPTRSPPTCCSQVDTAAGCTGLLLEGRRASGAGRGAGPAGRVPHLGCGGGGVGAGILPVMMIRGQQEGSGLLLARPFCCVESGASRGLCSLSRPSCWMPLGSRLSDERRHWSLLLLPGPFLRSVPPESVALPCCRLDAASVAMHCCRRGA